MPDYRLIKGHTLSKDEILDYKDFGKLIDTYSSTLHTNRWKWILSLGSILLIGSFAVYYGVQSDKPEIPKQNAGSVAVIKPNDEIDYDIPKGIEKITENVNEVEDVQQDDLKNKSVVSTTPKQTSEKPVEPVPTFVEASPLLGYDSLYAILNTHLRYPATAKDRGITGTVVVAFNIDTSGNVSEVRVIQSLGKSLDEEAIRLINKMDAWFPAKLKGVPIETRLSIPIHFDLLENE